MQANQWYRCGFQAFSNANLNDLNLSGQVFLNFGSGWVPSVYFMSAEGTTSENGVPRVAGQAMTFESQPFFVPQVPAAGGYLFINGLFTGTVGGQTLSIGRAFCRIVPNPYAVASMLMVSESASQILPGQTSTLTVNPGAGGAFTFQWYQGASGDLSLPVSGATGASFTTPALGKTTTYWVRAINGAGTIENSSTITVVVIAGAGNGGADGPLPLWAQCALGAGLFGIARRRLNRAAARRRTQ